MKLATKIFKRSDWYVTSPFGWRIHPITKKKSFHNGCDYGTNVQKWPQYAIEEGYVNEVVISKSKTGYGTYIWVRYPRINRSLLHAHLDKVVVKKGDKVKEGTLLGYTGKTGYATGIHLHLGMTEIGKHTWLDPDTYDYQPAPEPEPEPTPTPAPTPSDKFNIGDKVVINGALYTSSNASSPAGSISNKVTNITRKAPGTAHPYNTTGDLGWMDESSISAYVEPTPTPTPTPTPSIELGDSVIVNGRGSASSNGTGRTTKKYINKKMKVILINKGAKSPYALNQYNTGKVGSAAAVTAWFSEDKVKKV